MVTLVGCAHEHTWKEATCTEPKTCSKCGETEGEPLGHVWQDPTCSKAKACERCGEKEGYALGHDWKEATCTEPATCSRCGETKGEALGHDAEGVTCTESGVCKRCGETIPAAGHKWKEATCTEPMTCSVCGATEGAALGHTTTNGVCERCGNELYEKVSGSGDDVISDITVGDGLYCVHFVNSGYSNFIVKAYDNTGDYDLLINEIGAYNGYVFLPSEGPYQFEIKSSGSWSYQIIRLKATDQKEFSGTGDYVTDIFSGESGTWEFSHNGSGNFVIWMYTTNGRDLLVNEIGSYSGKKVVSIPSGSMAILVVTADGEWSAKPVK